MSYDFDSGYYEDGIEQALDREHQAGVRANERRRRAAVQPAAPTPPTGTGREALATVLSVGCPSSGSHISNLRYRYDATCDKCRQRAQMLADRLLASDWLAAVVADAKAEAWDEGYDAGHQDARAVQPTYPDSTGNPYRAGGA